jgi:hypothetical protein
VHINDREQFNVRDDATRSHVMNLERTFEGTGFV